MTALCILQKKGGLMLRKFDLCIYPRKLWVNIGKDTTEILNKLKPGKRYCDSFNFSGDGFYGVTYPVECLDV